MANNGNKWSSGMVHSMFKKYLPAAEVYTPEHIQHLMLWSGALTAAFAALAVAMSDRPLLPIDLTLLSFVVYSFYSARRRLGPTSRDFFISLLLISALVFEQTPFTAILYNILIVRMLFRTGSVRLRRVIAIAGAAYVVASLPHLDIHNKGQVVELLYGLGWFAMLAYAAATLRAELYRSWRGEQQMHEILQQSNRNYQMALTDGLTGLYNRRAYAEKVERLNRYVLLIVDIDHFKKWNDTYGHAAGDKVLIRLANIMKLSMREGDMPFRYGGEEFAIVLPNTSLQMGEKVAERLRGRVAESDFGCGAATAPVTISVGAAIRRPGFSSQKVFEQADQALYAAKQHGRNRVEVYQEGMNADDSVHCRMV